MLTRVRADGGVINADDYRPDALDKALGMGADGLYRLSALCITPCAMWLRGLGRTARVVFLGHAGLLAAKRPGDHALEYE